MHLRPIALCIGGQKCGTTALFAYLANHYQVAPPRIKEIKFFNWDNHYRRGIEFYHSHFPLFQRGTQKRVTMDVTPGYMIHAKRCAPRIFRYSPAIKLIVLLRDPVDRAYSAWHMYRKFYLENPNWFSEWIKPSGNETNSEFIRRPEHFGRDFCQDVQDELDMMANGQVAEMPFVQQGLYNEQLAHYLKYFSTRQFLFVFSEDLKRNTVRELRRLESFIGLDAHPWPDAIPSVFDGGYQSGIEKSAKQLLSEFYAEPSCQLSASYGLNLPWMTSQHKSNPPGYVVQQQ